MSTLSSLAEAVHKRTIAHSYTTPPMRLSVLVHPTQFYPAVLCRKWSNLPREICPSVIVETAGTEPVASPRSSGVSVFALIDQSDIMLSFHGVAPWHKLSFDSWRQRSRRDYSAGLNATDAA